MKRIFTIAMIAVAAFTCTAQKAQAAENADLTIVFIAYQNPEQLAGDVEPVVAHLEKELGVTIKHFVATNYAVVVEALRNKTADMGFMGPLQYVMANHYAGAEPLLGEVYQGKPNYVSKIFVRKDSGIETLADLKGKSIAFTDPISSSGYLYPMELFRTEGLLKSDPSEFFGRHYFAGGDEQAIRAVFNKFVDAAAIGQFAYSLLRPNERSQVHSIADSKPLPSHCIVVRQGLDPKLKEGLRDSLLAIQDGPNKHLLEQLYGVDGYVPVDHDTFKDVVDIAKKHKFIK